MQAPPAQQRAQAQAAAPQAVIPFVNASHEHTESFFDDTRALGTAAINVGPVNVPSSGYIRHIFLEVSFTGGTVGSATFAADYPFNIFQSIALVDTNGAPIFGPLDGFATMVCNYVGGYAFQGDPRKSPAYSATFNGTFTLRIPVEISHHDALGCLANQNSAASYQLQYVLNPGATLYAVQPTALPSVRVRASLEAWTLPNPTDRAGRPQAQLPPAHGTTQYFSNRIAPVAVGNNTLQFTRVGNLIRNLILINRDVSGVRVDTVMPNPALLMWDGRMIKQDTQNYLNQSLYEKMVNPAVSHDAGVFVYPFNHSVDNNLGDDTPALWLATVQAARLELQGVAAVAGNMQMITNDVAPGEVNPAMRYSEGSLTGFHPQVGASNAGAQ